jgi:oligoribonuclease (3'-5' exoribonuclease)
VYLTPWLVFICAIITDTKLAGLAKNGEVIIEIKYNMVKSF